MGVQEMQDVLSLIAGDDLSALQFHLVKLDTDGTVIKCTAGAQAIGVLLNKPLDGQVAEIASLQRGRVKVASAATLGTIGTRLTSDGNGFAVAAASTDFVIGIQLTATTDLELVEVLCLQSYKRE